VSGYKKPIERKNGSHPGIWMDDDGIHYSIPDLLDVFGWSHDEEHQRWVENALCRFLAENFPTAPIVYLHHCPHCGVSGKVPHGESCPYNTPKMTLQENNGKQQQNNGAK